MNWKKLSFWGFLSFSLFLSSCTEDTDDGPTLTDGVVEIELSQLPDDGDNFDYHLWIQSNGINFYMGSFEVENGLPSQTQWSFGDLETLEDAMQAFVSLSPAGVTPSAPDRMVMLEANFMGSNITSFGTAVMTTDVEPFNGATGQYFLATPTTSTMSEEFSGIWFGDNSSGSVLPSLNLPTLSSGWTYQGWVNLGNGMVLRTGKFYDPSAADLEDIYNGPLNGYDVPGEDFNQNLPMMGNPPNLRGKEVWLTVQPDTLTDELFVLPVFRDTITTSVMTTTPLTNRFPDFAGTISRR